MMTKRNYIYENIVWCKTNAIRDANGFLWGIRIGRKGGFNYNQAGAQNEVMQWFREHLKSDAKVGFKINKTSIVVFYNRDTESQKIARAMADALYDITEAYKEPINEKVHLMTKDFYAECKHLVPYHAHKYGLNVIE